MFQWLRGPGKVFKHPLPGSTNYLSAYDPKGQLYRKADSKAQGGRNEGEEDEDGSFGNSQKDMNLAGPEPIPIEGPTDLKPYPLNPGFTSQPVLAEDIKEAIFKDVSSGVMTVREASERYKVEMSRVGAVVRLKSVESNWKKEVRRSTILSAPSLRI
jgi:hypothetical protein